MVTFKNWISTHNYSHDSVAKRLGVSRAYVSQLAHYKKTPSLHTVKAILLISNGELKAEDLVNEFTK